MPLPTPLLRRNPNVHKNDFGHLFVLAGSRTMLGAAALTGLAAMRCGAGLVTIGIPKSLNLTAQKKISPVIMTLPLEETREGTLSEKSFPAIKKFSKRCQALALGPGLSRHPGTQRLIREILSAVDVPMVIDADALNQVTKSQGHKVTGKPKILTPHPGEMARLIKKTTAWVQANREQIAADFSRRHNVILVLKGHRTIVAAPNGKISINKTGNAGMASAGSGDVLTGVIAAFLAQGLPAFDAARWGVYLHGLAGDLAAKKKTKTAMIATDIIDYIPEAIKISSRK